MGLSSEKCQGKKSLVSLMDSTANLLREPFQFFTTILLSLLFPLSFLILSRLSIAHYLIDLFGYSTTETDSDFLIKFFLHANPTFLHILVSLISVAALTHSLTGGTSCFIRRTSEPVSRPRLYTAWIFLCILQICVGLGIEGSIAAGADGHDLGNQRGFLTRAIFFLGLHETMFFWSKTVVKPVVDDTVFGVARENRLAEKVALAMGFGGLWWWRLRDEVESLVVVVEKKRDLLISIGLVDFVGWWLYYLTVTIGLIKVVKGLIWVVYVMFGRRVVDTDITAGDSVRNDEKV
ncbi:uncharacterized protein LOC107815627 [Nicotiana tabacum]|uniref:Uncharacterized protein LOC107815627 n=2 Tax=Nicotiana TaxID=4085 RepID=A0A1S4C678_TOBAC|nr:PREDICTED: uncharacterized protein LOC104222567 [Nicotiana sylvestris]XP_016496727.1 PREDICTED: uncharacterized protein LOC107815627 [Nicotiana tabacum]